MILTHAALVQALRILDEARVKAVEGNPLYCTKKEDGRDGVHGRVFLGINVATGEVVCARCKNNSH